MHKCQFRSFPNGDCDSRSKDKARNAMEVDSILVCVVVGSYFVVNPIVGRK